MNRRDFFKKAGIASTGLVVAASPAAANSAAAQPNNEELGMLYDATRCVGCKACMAACKRVNAGPGALAFETADFDQDALWDAPTDLSGDTRTIIKLFKENHQWSYIKYSCMHCQTPSCVSVCPVKAMTKDPVTGIVDYSKDNCIGCRYCQVACPFNIPKFQWDRTIPRIVKCDLCRETNLKDKGITACAETCPTGAILFGKRAELLREARARLEQHPDKYVHHIYGEHEVGGTNHLYLAALPFARLGLPDLQSDAPATFSEKIQHTIYKGFIAPVALYTGLCLVAFRNMKRFKTGHPELESTEGRGTGQAAGEGSVNANVQRGGGQNQRQENK
ncbi:MAG: hydrogenase 2 operon protein HybA [Limisphaerales bacterium]